MKQGPSFLLGFAESLSLNIRIYPWAFCSRTLLLKVLNVTTRSRVVYGGREAVLQPKNGYSYSSKPAFPAILISSAELLKLSFL